MEEPHWFLLLSGEDLSAAPLTAGPWPVEGWGTVRQVEREREPSRETDRDRERQACPWSLTPLHIQGEHEHDSSF